VNIQRTVIAFSVFASMGVNLAVAQQPAPSTETPTIVTLGDSITKGFRSGVTNEETFSAITQTILHEDGVACRVVNKGIGGERTDQALKRLDAIIKLKPRLVTVMYGTNDSYVDAGKTSSRITVDEYRDNLHKIVQRLLVEGIEPVLMTEPRWAADAGVNGSGEHPNIRLEQFVKACREVAARLDVPLVDQFAHWTKAESQGQKLRDWTTDGCHPNPVGHRQLAELMGPVLLSVLKPGFTPNGYRIERETVMTHDDGEFLWFHPHTAAIPQNTGPPSVVMLLQKHLYTSDYYSGLSVLRTDDLGESWSDIETPGELGWVHDGEVDIAAADMTPGWHPQTGKVIAVGAQVRYSAKGEQLEDQPRSNQTAYTVFDPTRDKWSSLRRLEMPAGDQFNLAWSANAQFVVEPDGSVLLPFYAGLSTAVPLSTTVVRCSFDGDELKYREQGNVITLNVKRGLCEPSLTKFNGRYFLTIRNDLNGYVTVSDDGLNYRPIKRWHFDDGEDLGSYNTQQHWLTQNGGLFLVYTRRGASNDHIMRNRAPLFIAQVDPQRLHVVRATEQVLLPERGATLGNFGVTSVTQDESWVTVAEGVWKDEARHRGATGATMLARVKPAIQQPPGSPQTTQKLTSDSEPVNAVCFGDSVTGLYYHTGGRRAYTALLELALQRLCPQANITTINAGISGNTTRNALARIDADVLAKNPSVVTVMFGLNDLVGVPIEEYRANLQTIVEKIRAVGAEVVLCTPNSVITTASRPVEKLEQYCDVVREIANEQKVALCDCYAAYQSLREQDAKAWRLLMSDEIHPNCNGHKRIAEQIAQTITGREVSLTDVSPLRPAMPHTFAKLRAGEAIKVLAMPPFDQSIAASLKEVVPEASVEVIPWPVDGLSISQLEQDAKARVRGVKPDLVVLAPPRNAAAASWDEFVKSYAWIMNWSLSFGRQEWDAVVVHPNVDEPQGTAGEFDELVRQLVNAQDLTLVDRPSDTTANGKAVFGAWLQREWKFAPVP
jgi:lysophospholipase L1-like esterase